MLLTQTSQLDYEELCKLVILGLVETPRDLWSKNPGLLSNLWQQRLGWETRFNYSPSRVDLSPYGDNLLVNVKVALEGIPVTRFNGWLDSTVALFWITRSGQYKQFSENWVQKIHAQPKITWRHVPTWQNPVDLASSVGDVEFQQLLWHDPEWMSHSKCWPVQQVIQACETSREGIKVQREVFAVAVDTTDRMDGVLEKFKLSKAINICAWISRFLCNSHQDDYLWLNLQPNQRGTLECRGRI